MKNRYVSIKIPKEQMLDILYEPADGEVISDNITDNGRWTIYHDLVFRFDNKIYMTSYGVGATENQDEHPWEYDDEVECYEVKEVEVTVKQYQKVKLET